MVQFTDQVAVVTGASGGLGTNVTEAFLSAGAMVIGVARNIAQGEAGAPTPGFTAMAADLSSTEAVNKLVAEIIRRFGRIDILAHLVGGFAGGLAVPETDDQVWERMMEMNVASGFRVFRAVIPQMRKAGRGRIVAIGSRASVEPGPHVGAYSASKAAMLALVRTVALENADLGITANLILPGTIDTPANRKAMPKADFSKWVQPRLIAELVLFLASDRASQISGAAIPIYGSGL